MRKIVKCFIIAHLIIGLMFQCVQAADTPNRITKNDPGQRPGIENPIPTEVIVEQTWLGRNKWWVILGVVVAGAAAAAAGGGGGGDEPSPPPVNTDKDGQVSVTW